MERDQLKDLREQRGADYCAYINDIRTVSELQRDQYKYAMREYRTVFWGAVMIIIVLALGALGG